MCLNISYNEALYQYLRLQLQGQLTRQSWVARVVGPWPSDVV